MGGNVVEPMTSSSEAVARNTDIAQGPVPVTAHTIQDIGLATLALASVLLLTALVVGAIYTASPPGPCFPANGGTQIPCPPTPLTLDNLFVLITLVIFSVGSFILGGVLVTMAWLHRHPAA
jgi:hypothetical protein